MPTLEGIPVSPGYAEGTAIVYAYEIERRLVVPRRSVSHSELGSEHARLDDAVEEANRELRRAAQSAHGEPGQDESADLLAAQSRLMDDLSARVKQRIGRELVNVEQVLDDVVTEFVERLSQLDNAYFRERRHDIRDVQRRILGHLTGAPPWSRDPLPADSVIVACELLPSEIIELARCGLAAIVAEEGGKNCHMAILARSLGIPAVTGISTATTQIQPGMRLLVDGKTGRVIIDPSPSEMERFSKLKQAHERSAHALTAGAMLPCITQDGVEISLLASIGRPEEIEQVGVHNLSSVGLFRTEFLFLESRERPSFQVQLEVYERAARALEGRPLVIRTFDLGGDKWPAFLSSEQAGLHPCRHLRGLRFCLAEGRLFETQLRAIVQAAQGKDVRLLFPMVVGSHDFSRAAGAVDGVVHELGVARRPPIGAMIETPAALFALEEIFEFADFAAIGTNDLTQYMLAADRDAADLIAECTPMHPAVLRAIKRVIEVAGAKHRPVCVCGEEAGDEDFACLLVGLGIRELSMNPTRSAAVRQRLRNITCQSARHLASEALCCRAPEEVQHLFERWWVLSEDA
jgi:phosphoenolpyruvate-protein phosphotransferase (PTS system enzyme I)